MKRVLVFLLLFHAVASTFDRMKQCFGTGDVAFAIDGSESVGETNFEIVKNFTIETIDNMVIGPDSLNIAAMIFSSSLTLEDQFDFHEYQEKQHLKELIGNMFYIREGTRTDLAIKRMQEMLDSAPRKNVPKIMVLITDGKSASPVKTIAEAKLSKSKLTHIIVVGVNIESSDISAIHEIHALVSDPDMILWISFDHLRFNSPEQLMDIICQIATTTTTSTTTTTTITMTPTSITTPRTAKTNKLTMKTTEQLPPDVVTSESLSRSLKIRRTLPEECIGCFIHDGIGYNPHLQLCYKFYQCIYENYDVVKYTHTCPFGLFWSQKALSCVDPKVAECEKDPCKKMDHVGILYEMEDVCNGYWECVNEEGKIFSKAMCCADGHVYEPVSAICVRDTIGICNHTVCNVQEPTESYVCPYEPVPGDMRMFRFSIWLGPAIIDLPCSPGTIFDPNRCTCVNVNVNSVQVPKECKPAIHMKFDGNFMDEAGVNNEKTVSRVTLMNFNPSPAGGPYAHFNGSSFINLYSLANTYYGKEVAIHFWMRPVPGIPDGPETIITNCLLSTGFESNQCLHSDCNPSIQIELNKVTSKLNHKLVLEDGETRILESDISIGKWVEVWYVYDGSKNRRFVTDTSSSREDHVMTTGIVGQRQSGIVIGRPETNAFKNYYKGDIDEFEFYHCIPKKAKHDLKNID